MRISVRQWKVPMVVLFTIGTAWWGWGYGSVSYFLGMLNELPQVRVETSGWSAWVPGSMRFYGLRFQDEEGGVEWVRGTFLVRYSPLSIFSPAHRRFHVTGTDISSEWIQKFAPGSLSRFHDGYMLDSELDITLSGEIKIRSLRITSDGVELLTVGSVAASGEWHLDTTFRASKKYVDAVALGWGTSGSGDHAASSTDIPFEGKCLLRGSIDHPRIQFESNFFRLDIG